MSQKFVKGMRVEFTREHASGRGRFRTVAKGETGTLRDLRPTIFGDPADLCICIVELDKDGTTTWVHDSKLRLAPPEVMDTEDQLEAVRAAVRAVGGLGVGGRVEFSSTGPDDLTIKIVRAK